jgi:hypothetical protein
VLRKISHPVSYALRIRLELQEDVHTKIPSMSFENIALEVLQHVPVGVSLMVDARLGEVDWHDGLSFPLR